MKEEKITVIVKLTNNAFSKTKSVLIEKRVETQKGKIVEFNHGSLELLVVVE